MLEGVSRVEQFEAIRRDFAREELSIRALARRHGVHRRAVRQALADPVPPPKRPPASRPASRPAPKLGAYRSVIEDWLRADAAVPRKQRHTARRIWQRLVAEYGAEVSERQVDRYVAAARRRLGEVEAFVPLVADAGVEAEVDWGQAQVLLREAPVMVHVFLMRACHSGASFAVAYRAETQQAFLEGHVCAFEWFGGVFETVRYDNLGSAVARVLKGVAGWSATGSSRCARTTCSSRCSACPASKGRTRRAALRTRSAVSAAIIWCRSPADVQNHAADEHDRLSMFPRESLWLWRAGMCRRTRQNGAGACARSSTLYEEGLVVKWVWGWGRHGP